MEHSQQQSLVNHLCKAIEMSLNPSLAKSTRTRYTCQKMDWCFKQFRNHVNIENFASSILHTILDAAKEVRYLRGPGSRIDYTLLHVVREIEAELELRDEHKSEKKPEEEDGLHIDRILFNGERKSGDDGAPRNHNDMLIKFRFRGEGYLHLSISGMSLRMEGALEKAKRIIERAVEEGFESVAEAEGQDGHMSVIDIEFTEAEKCDLGQA